MLPRALLLALPLLLATLPLPVARATQLDGHGLSPAQRDIAEQFAINVQGNAGCTGTPSSAVSISAGKRYFLTAGTMSPGSYAATGSTSGLLWNNGGGTLTNVKAGTNAVNVRQAPKDGAIQSTIYFTALATETVTIICTSGGMQAYYTPTISCTAALACVGPFSLGGFNVGVLLDADVALLSESGILGSETSRTPTDTKFVFNRLNEPRTIVNTPSANLQAPDNEPAQYIAPVVGAGKYLEIFSFQYRNSHHPCTEKITFTVSRTLTSPWDVNEEMFNISWTYTSTGNPTSALATIDLLNGLAETAESGSAFSIPTLTRAGVPDISQGAYLRLKGFDTNCFQVEQNTASPYTAGAVHYWTGTSWVQRPTNDLAGMFVKTYGGETRTYYHNLTAHNVGGAVYAWVKEKFLDQNLGRYSITTTYGGRAKHMQQIETGNGYEVKEWRLGYLNLPHNTSNNYLVEVTLTDTGRNPLYVGVLGGAQPSPQPHLVRTDLPQGSGPNLPAYTLFSTDDHFTRATFSVVECTDDACYQLGTKPVSPTYEATICPAGRVLAGTADTAGRFTLAGQDLGGCVTTITLRAQGYDETTYTIDIPASGDYNFTLGLLKSTTSQGTATLASVKVAFQGNTTVFIPGRIEINVTRARSVALFLGASHVDPASGKWIHNVVRPHYWAADEPNTFKFYYPERVNSSAQHRGAYVLWVMNETGRILAHTKYFLVPAGQNATQYDFLFTTGDLRLMEEAGYPSALQSFHVKNQANLLAQERSVREEVYSDFKTISDFGGYVLLFLLFLAAVRAFRR